MASTAGVDAATMGGVKERADECRPARGRDRRGGLLQDLAGAREATDRTEDARALLVETRAAVDESFREAVAHRESFFRVLDRRREHALEAEAAVVGHQVAGHRSNARPTLWEAVRERSEVERFRCRARAVVRLHLSSARVVDQREEVAADPGAVRLRHGAHSRGRDRRVDGAAAITKDGDACGGREMVVGRHQSVHRTDRRSRGHRKMLSALARQTSRPMTTRATTAAADAMRRPRPSDPFGRGTSGIRASARATSGQFGLPFVSNPPKST